MPQILIEYTKTEVTRERVWVEAASPAEALRIVERYEFDNSQSYEVASLSWEISDTSVEEVTPEEPEATDLPVAITCERGDTIQVVHRVATVAEAEEWISVGLADDFLDEDDVEQGRYGIDAPEEMINP